MGNIPLPKASSSSTTSSKSRHQHPQYNPDNESSAQLGQATSEHLQSLPLAKWDTGTSDEAASPVPASPSAAGCSRAKDETKPAVAAKSGPTPGVDMVIPIREKVNMARASTEAVRGSPPMEPGSDMESRLDDEMCGGPWGPANVWCCEGEIANMGGWMTEEEQKKCGKK